MDSITPSNKINNQSDLEEALRAYSVSGNVDVLHEIGWYYDKTLKDEETASKYYELNIKNKGESYKLSTYNLAHILRFKDRKRSKKLFKTIIPEDLDALYLLGSYYQWSKPEKAMKYWNQAIEQGDARTLCELAKCYTRKYKPFEYNPDKALELYIKAAEELDYKKAYMYLSDFYRSDIGVIRDLEKEVGYLLKVPEEDLDQTHLFNLGLHLAKGHGGITRDYDKAMRIFRELDEKYNDKDAQYMIGELYRYGHGVKIDKEESKKWFVKSAKQLDMVACKRLLETEDIEDDEYQEFFELLLKSRSKYYYEIEKNCMGSSMKFKLQALDTMYQELTTLRKKVEEYELRPPLIGGELFRQARNRFNIVTKDHLV